MTAAHAAWDELAAGYAVNALEPEEEETFTAHLRGCDRCQETLESLREVTAHLAYAAEPAEPPADLGRRILDAAAAERPASFAKSPPGTVPIDRPRRSRAPRRGRVWQPTFHVATLAAAAAILAVLGMGVWNLSLRGDGDAQQAALQRRDAALQCLTAPESQKFQLTSAGGQRAKTCLAGGSAYLVVDRLDRNDPASSVYVLWWMDAQEKPHAVERFDVESSGTGVYALPLNVSPAEVRAMAISLEPGRGLPSVPTRPIASGTATSA